MFFKKKKKNADVPPVKTEEPAATANPTQKPQTDTEIASETPYIPLVRKNDQWQFLDKNKTSASEVIFRCASESICRKTLVSAVSTGAMSWIIRDPDMSLFSELKETLKEKGYTVMVVHPDGSGDRPYIFNVAEITGNPHWTAVILAKRFCKNSQLIPFRIRTLSDAIKTSLTAHPGTPVSADLLLDILDSTARNAQDDDTRNSALEIANYIKKHRQLLNGPNIYPAVMSRDNPEKTAVFVTGNFDPAILTALMFEVRFCRLAFSGGEARVAFVSGDGERGYWNNLLDKIAAKAGLQPHGVEMRFVSPNNSANSADETSNAIVVYPEREDFEAWNDNGQWPSGCQTMVCDTTENGKVFEF